MTTSTHKVEVVPVSLQKHPNADTLSIVKVFNYTVCVRTEDWEKETLGAYIVPDTLVDIRRPEFNFLEKAGHIYNEYYHRVKVKKLRGVVSQGLLVKCPPESKIGDDLAEYFGVIRYEASESVVTGGDFESGPLFGSKYDLDSAYRYSVLFEKGELVHISEKIDGSNARFLYENGRMWCGSRSGWKKEDPTSAWWIALNKYPSIVKFCESNQNTTLFGEIYGHNGKMPYSAIKGNIRFAAFDVQKEGEWLGPHERNAILGEFDIPTVPILANEIPFDQESIFNWAEGQTLIGNYHLREGCVVEPLIPRFHPKIGRVKLKIVGNGYLDKS